MTTDFHTTESVAETKRRFVSMVSHELRTPLTAIKGAVDLVRRGQAGPLVTHQDRLLGMASRNIGRLAAILDDLLDLSKLEAGRLPLRPSRREIQPLVTDLLDEFQQMAAEAGLRLDLRCSPNLPEVFVDGQRIDQVLSNLLSNAIKFTPEGGTVTLVAERTVHGVLLAVEDTGVGIAEKDQQHVFEPFRQVEDVMTRCTKGTGLGLSIASALVRQHGTELRLESQVGEGSRFSFELSAEIEKVRELLAWDRELEWRRASVLVVELVGMDDGPPISIPERRHLLELVQQRLTSELPRATDEVSVLAASGLVLVTLSETDRDGARLVRDRLRRRLESSVRQDAALLGMTPIVCGPSACPADGQTSHELILAARRVSTGRAADVASISASGGESPGIRRDRMRGAAGGSRTCEPQAA